MRKTITIIIAALLLLGCQSFSSSRRAGLKSYDVAMSGLTEVPGMKFELDGCTKIVVYGTRAGLMAKMKELKSQGMANLSKDYYQAGLSEDNIRFCAFTVLYESADPEIHIIGARDPKTGKIYINEACLGHEIHHLINLKNPVFLNPDLGMYGSTH
jgi:hypothetical protein